MSTFKHTFAQLAFVTAIIAGAGPASAQFGDLLKNALQIGQAAGNIGGFGRELQEFIDSIKSIQEVTIDPRANSPASSGQPSTSTDKVVLYTTQTCGYCKLAMKHVRDNQIPHIEKDIKASTSNAAEFKKLGGSGVPHIVMGPTVMRGFSAANFDRQYAIWKADTRPANPVSTAPAIKTEPVTTAQ